MTSPEHLIFKHKRTKECKRAELSRTEYHQTRTRSISLGLSVNIMFANSLILVSQKLINELDSKNY